MSGHSKWANIKHKKALVDAKRGNTFTKISMEIMVAAKNGGGNPDGNFRLKLAIQNAKEANIPHDNIVRAIQRGTGELEGSNFEEFSYEGYGPGGVAVLLELMSDNRNRTASEIRYIFSRHGGNLGESGCVGWMFKKKGLLVIDAETLKMSEDDLMALVLDAGAEDMTSEEGTIEVICAPEAFQGLKEALDAAKIETVEAAVTMIPQTTMELHGKEAWQAIRLTDALESHDDVQNVYSNYSVDEEEVEKYAAERQ